MRDELIAKIISVEGGYVFDPKDSGGETNHGITVAVARENGFNGDMRTIPMELVRDIYIKRYWTPINGDELWKQSAIITEEVLDTGVNMGINRAGLILQRSLNVLNDQGRYYKDLIVDGHIGNNTIIALQGYLTVRDEEVLYSMLNCLQGSFYVRLAERREKDERFMYGWFKNRVN